MITDYGEMEWSREKSNFLIQTILEYVYLFFHVIPSPTIFEEHSARLKG